MADKKRILKIAETLNKITIFCQLQTQAMRVRLIGELERLFLFSKDMAWYNPFAERAGMQKIAEIFESGFNIHLLSSENYVLDKLQSLSRQYIDKIKEAFIKHSHARFMKYFFCHIPFGRKQEYAQEVRKASLDSRVLIKVCGFLMQIKAYLFWSMSSSR